MNDITISEIRKLASRADAKELDALKRSLVGDTRKGVASILEQAQRRLDAENAEIERIAAMYSFERAFCDNDSEICVGLDEVGRGPIAGPVAVGAVVLPKSPQLAGLNDSKKLTEEKRESAARSIMENALAHTVVFVDAKQIDDKGIAICLKMAFTQAIDAIDKEIGPVNHVLLDGNPLYIDKREINIVKGDGKCASIAAASIIAKVARDAHMREFDTLYPEYGFVKNKGYGTEAHMNAIKEIGLCDIHRKSFCSGIIQETLF